MAYAITVAAGAGDVQGFTGATTLVGYSIRETSAAAAVLQLRDGTTTGDPVKATILLAAGASQTAMLPGVTFSTGIFVDRTSGTTEIVLYLS